MMTQENIPYTVEEIKAMVKTIESLRKTQKKYKEALERARKESQECVHKDCDDTTRRTAITIINNLFPELKDSEDKRIRKGIIRNLQYLMERSEGFVKEDLQERIAWLENQCEQKQTWKPSEAQLIVIKDLIEDKNTSKVNKVVLRGMFDEFKQFTNTHKREIDDAYLQGICDAKHEIEKQGESTETNIEIPFGASDSELQEVSYYIPEGFYAEIKDDRVIIKKVEPTFKVGDWIVNTNSRLIWQITCIRNSLYYIRDVNGNEGYETYDGLRDNYHLWSINDAKDEHETMLREIQVVNAKDDKKDEKIRKGIIRNLQYLMERSEEGFVKEDLQERIAWLEKQDKHQQLYIRFGDIPLNEISKIYRGEEEIGSENGVSVYPAFEFINGNIVLGLSLPITKTTLDTQLCLLEYENRPCYLVKGDYIGNDSDGQPLINNITIIKKIDNYRIKHDKKD